MTGDPRDVAALVSHRRQPFAGGCWWSRPQLDAADPALFDPHMGRFLAKIRGQPRA